MQLPTNFGVLSIEFFHTNPIVQGRTVLADTTFFYPFPKISNTLIKKTWQGQ